LQDGLDVFVTSSLTLLFFRGYQTWLVKPSACRGCGAYCWWLGAIATYTRSRIGAVSGNYDSADESDIDSALNSSTNEGIKVRNKKMN
jgi:hypothetical protein